MKSSRLSLAAGTLVACASVASLTPALAAAPPRAHAASTTTVTLKDISFKKATVKIAKGGSVRWVWKDGDTPHNVTFATKHSKTQKSGSYTLRFARAGTFKYHCTIHPGMDGKIVVR
ncbi:cupredoxin domain-containing protein [Baekduia sp.]|jgi:plastocyanin|uniref:cupredoxin domain-containing protein n=1 Tax=Baekduia sp. TaxID=2600305 RepID=UPI002E093DB8|nr:plastocyanin/azurin family copper-binding protein [Baekduia sp.]